MHFLAGVDEVASETQVSEGWTYAVLPPASVIAIDAAVANCTVKTFHGREFRTFQAQDYETLLKAAGHELLDHPEAILSFRLLDASWKREFRDFVDRLISGSMSLAGVTDATAIKIAQHFFPGLITLQELTKAMPGATIEIEVDSDDRARLLASHKASMAGYSVPTASLLVRAYEGYRNRQFPNSPRLVSPGIRAFDDSHSRVIQLADVFGNFALAFIFVQLGCTSKTRATKAAILQQTLGFSAQSLDGAATLRDRNDIELVQPGGLTLRVGT